MLPLPILLTRSESDTLDFKRESYSLDRDAPEDKKYELLKDLLAFANTIREANAYIIIGAKKPSPDQPAELFPVATHPDDAQLQQFVNSKTNRPIRFTYAAMQLNGQSIGIFTIPPDQERPLFLTKKYGPILPGAVKIRRGSSTADATPDEIAMMGELRISAPAPPTITLEFAQSDEKQRLGRNITVDAVQIVDPPPQPPSPSDYATVEQALAGGHRFQLLEELRANNPMLFGKSDRDRKKDLVAYARGAAYGLWIKNLGDRPATDIRIEIRGDISIHITSADNACPPAFSVAEVRSHLGHNIFGIHVEEQESSWMATATVKRLVPKEATWIEATLWIEGAADFTHEATALIFANELPNPVEIPLTITIATREKFYDPAMLKKAD